MAGATFDHDEARRLRAEGWKLKDIAAHFDITSRRAEQVCSGVACSIDHTGAARRMSSERKAQRTAEAVALLRTGLTTTEVARRLGVNRVTISKATASLLGRERKAADARARALPAKIEIPAWVPDDLHRIYAVTADREDEHAAASLCRRLKASGAVACRGSGRHSRGPVRGNRSAVFPP